MRQTLAVVSLAVMAVLTAARVHVWSSERRLWTEAAQHSPLKPRPWINLAREYALDGQDALAVGLFYHAETLAIKGSVEQRYARGNRAVVEARWDDSDNSPAFSY
jgi:hypothetical protein